MKGIKAIQYNPYDPPEDDFPRCLRTRRGNHWYNFGHWGHIGFIAGPRGTMKTTTIRSIVAAGLSGEERLQTVFDLGDRCIIWADGQQPEDIFNAAQKQTLELAGKTHDDRLISLRYNHISSPQERMNDLYKVINDNRKHLGMVIIDVASDFMQDPNSRFESVEIINGFNKLGARLGVITLFITHTTDVSDKTKQPSKLFGSFGTELHNLASWGFINVQQGKYFGWTKGKFRYKPFPNLWFTREGMHLHCEPYFPF